MAQFPIKNENSIILTHSVLNGIDFNNLIATVLTDYTAVQDCFAVQTDSTNALKMGINGVTILEYAKSNSTNLCSGCLFVKAGQVVNVNAKTTRIYGIKR